MFNARSKLVTAAAVAAAAVSGAAIANAATSGSTSTTAGTTQSQTQDHRHSVGGRTEQALTGETARKVEAAAVAKVSGGTVERVETNVDGSAPYEAHIRKADGTEVEVQVSSDFTVAAVNDMGDMGDRHP